MRLMGYGVALALASTLPFLSLAPARADLATARKPVTLASHQGVISAFAHDNGRIAWIGDRGKVRIKTLSTRRIVVVAKARKLAPPGGAGGEPENFDRRQLALGNDRALWVAVSGGNSIQSEVRTASLSDRKPRAIGFHDYNGDAGEVPTASAGDESTLAYAWAFFRPEVEDFDSPDYCSAVTGGGMILLPGRREVFAETGAVPVKLAVSAGRLALVPADDSCDPRRNRGYPVLEPAPNGRVEVYAVSAKRISSFAPKGTVRAIAMSGPVVAVLVQNAEGAKSIRRYSATTGALIGSAWVGPGTAEELDLAGGTVVYRTGRIIRTMAVDTGRKSTLCVARVTPLDLSIEGKRVAWAENLSVEGKVRGRIRTVLLP